MKHIYSDILLVDKDLAWHHPSVATALWNGGFDVPLFGEVFFETKNVTSRVNRVTSDVAFANKKNFLATGMSTQSSTIYS